MIILEDKKSIILFNPKTGSAALFNSVAHALGYDTPIDEIKEGKFGHLHTFIEGYKYFCFYRNPYDKVLSSYYWHKRNVYYELIRMCKNEELSKFEHTRDPYIVYDHLPQELKEIIESITLDMFLNKIKKHEHESEYLQPQVNWLDTPNVTLLNYDNYDEELKRLFSILNLGEPKTFTINKVQKFSDDTTTLSVNQKEMVRKLYEKDFTFFESRGIIF